MWMQTYHIFCTKKTTFSILYTYFYKTPTSVHLLYTIFYINNIFIFFFNIILSPFLFPIFPILPLLSSSFFFFLFPYLSVVSSFFFFLFFLLLSLTIRSTLHHKHHNHQNPQAPPISVDPQAPIYTTSNDPHQRSTCSDDNGDGDEIASPLIHDHRSMIHKKRSAIKAPQVPF